MTLLGGLGTILGPAIGAALVVLLQNELADKVGSKVTIIMGLIFIFCVLSFRKGIVGEISSWLEKARESFSSVLLRSRVKQPTVKSGQPADAIKR